MTILDKEIAEMTRENLLSANTTATSPEWAEWRKSYTLEMMEKLNEVCE